MNTRVYLGDVATPQWLYDLLNARVKELTGQGFQLDAAAEDWNAKCADYLDEEMDALKQDWSKWATIFCNPPFSASLIERFIMKALQAADNGSTVVLLLPSWPGYPWFQELKRRGQIRDIIGPVAFQRADGSKVVLNNGYKTTALVVATLGPKVTAGFNGEPIGTAIEPDPSVNGKSMSVKRKNHKAEAFTLMSEVKPKEVEWLWEPYVPSGELTILDGDPSTNKSSFTLDLAARVSRGAPMPGEKKRSPRGGVLLLVAEDSLRKTLLPRLQAAGADLSRIAVLGETLSIPAGLPTIEAAARKIRAKLFIIDPLMAFLGRDAQNDQKVRQALMPLRALAERMNMAVILVRHLNKGGGRHPLYRGCGSIGIIGTTRSALLIGKHPEDPNMRVLCHEKCNLAPEGPSLLFEPICDDRAVVRIEWRGECDYKGKDLLKPAPDHEDKLGTARQFLLDALADGRVEQKELKAMAAKAAIAWRTIERAKEVLGVTSRRKGWGPGSRCFWELPKEKPETGERKNDS